MNAPCDLPAPKKPVPSCFPAMLNKLCHFRTGCKDGGPEHFSHRKGCRRTAGKEEGHGQEVYQLEELRIQKKEVLIPLTGRELKLQVVDNIEDLVTDVSDEDKVPCWADIWPAAYAMAHFLWDELPLLPGETVLELGAGMGLPGIACATRGCRVTLSDFNPTALELAGENARRNFLEVELLREDWREFRCLRKFDLLLASDVLYDPKLNACLAGIFQENLEAGGRIVVSHAQRRVTYEFLEAWLSGRNFQEELFMREVEVTGMLLPRYKIAIHILSRG